MEAQGLRDRPEIPTEVLNITPDFLQLPEECVVDGLCLCVRMGLCVDVLIGVQVTPLVGLPPALML